MSILKVELYPAPVLREKAKVVEEVNDEVLQLLDDMEETMENCNGAGLAANQVGVLKRVMIVDLGLDGGEKKIVHFINPELVESEGESVREEGCLSFPKLFDKVKRPYRAVVRALGRDGKPFELQGEGYVTHALLHELDHLDGVLFIDRISTIRREIIKRKIKKMMKEGEWVTTCPEE